MEETPLLPLPRGLQMTHIEKQETGLIIHVLSAQPTCCCPLCHTESDTVHSHYQRSLKDLPMCGQQICLLLTVRKFFCHNEQCQRKIFTERLPDFVEPWAQMTLRLSQALQAIGLSTSGSQGTRLASRLGIATSWMTILRRIMQLPNLSDITVSVLGVDDFSFKRGRKFGTILVDLSTHQVIDLLPERKVESAAAWMRNHPEIQYVSRDRGKDYAQAAREGAPQALAVGDRFHIMKNLVEAIEPVVARCYKELRKALVLLTKQALSPEVEWRQAGGPSREQQRLSRLANNQVRFEQMMELQKQGMKKDEIARRLGVTARTIQNWSKRGACPAHQRRRKRRSLFDPYAPSVLSQWEQGCHDITLIFHTIQAQGFTGNIRTVYRYIQTLKQGPIALPAPSVLDRVSVQEAIWLLVRPVDELKAEERAELDQLTQMSATLLTLHRLVQSFGQMLRKRQGHLFSGWKQQVETSGIAEIQRFVEGIEKDKEAVLAGLTESYSNGMTEGFVNKLKLIKRQGYGRASFPLLRQRVIHAL